MFGRGVRPRVDNSDHRDQRVYEGSALAVLYVDSISLIKRIAMYSTLNGNSVFCSSVNVASK